MSAHGSFSPRIAVIGAGIGGLVFSLALRRRGLAAEVFEQSAELERLGLLDDIAAASTEPTELIWRDGRDGRRVASHPVRRGDAYRTRFGAPYFGIHRASLQKVLSRAHGPEASISAIG